KSHSGGRNSNSDRCIVPEETPNNVSEEQEASEMQPTETRRWRLKGPEMEGPVARWYARVRGSESQLARYRRQALELTAGLPKGARVLEVAPGPGDRGIEIARDGHRAAGPEIAPQVVTT